MDCVLSIGVLVSSVGFCHVVLGCERVMGE